MALLHPVLHSCHVCLTVASVQVLVGQDTISTVAEIAARMPYIDPGLILGEGFVLQYNLQSDLNPDLPFSSPPPSPSPPR